MKWRFGFKRKAFLKKCIRYKMEEELNSLKKTADFFKKTTAKIKLLKLIKMAKAEYDKYDYPSGLDYLEEAYKTDKNNPVVLRGIGCIKQFQGKYKEALEYHSDRHDSLSHGRIRRGR